MPPASSTPAVGTPAGRPGLQRAYATLVVALATFLAAMVVLRVPFRGYLIEGRVSGCLDDSITAADVRQFLKEAASVVHARLDVQPSGRCEVVLQQLAPRAGDSQAMLNRIARQLSEQFVAQKREAGRQARLAQFQAELRVAREAEDAHRLHVDKLRQQQLAEASRPAEPAPYAPPAEVANPPAAESESRTRLISQLELLKNELLRILATKTEEHPEVITLRSQITRMESELGLPGPAAVVPPLEKHAALPVHEAETHPVAAFTNLDELDAQLDSAAADLLAATRARQWAERQLQAEVESLASIVPVPWSVESAQIVARVGGTPRLLTLLGAGLLTLITGVLMYRGSTVLNPRIAIHSVDEIVALLDLPLAGHTRVPAYRRNERRPGRLLPLVVRIVLHGAELFLVVMVTALFFTMLADRSLAQQVLVDPFGVLSEVAGRILG
jgi:hypothetical protein